MGKNEKEYLLVNNIQALTHSLEMAMEKDETIVVFGEDAGFEGGVFRATKGLQAKFGKERVFDSVLAEAVICGSAIGMAVNGLKPVIEMQFQGFSYPSFQQLFTHGARLRNRSRGRWSVPMVMRMPMGGGVRALEHHSEAIEAMFSHVPGIKVVMPSTPYDTKGLMLAAINDPDPVVFLEPKRLYRTFKQEIPADYYEVPIGKAHIMQEGKDLTIVTYGANTFDCRNALKQMQENGSKHSIELIDLRTISPIDKKTIIESVKKTGRLLIVHEAVKTLSVSAEIIAFVNENCFEYLEAKPKRLTGYDITVPLNEGEKYFMITPEKIKDAIEEVMAYVI